MKNNEKYDVIKEGVLSGFRLVQISKSTFDNVFIKSMERKFKGSYTTWHRYSHQSLEPYKNYNFVGKLLRKHGMFLLFRIIVDL